MSPLQNYRTWLISRVPSALLSALFTVSIVTLMGTYIAGGVGAINLDTLHLPGSLGWLWAKFLEDPGTWSAIVSGGFSMMLARVIIVNVKPLAKDRERMRALTERLGTRKGAVLYAALTLPYLGFGVALVSIWLGFKLAGIMLAAFYPFIAVDTVKTGVYAWLQQPPGATLYALRQIFIFGKASGDEKEKEKKGLGEVLKKHPQLFGSFGPELRLSRRFYLRGVPVILLASLGLFVGYGALLLNGYASGEHPATWKVSSVVITSVLAGVWIGWFGCWIQSLIVWSNTFGRPRSKDEWWGVNKAAFASMMGSTLGPSSQGVGFLMAALLIHGQSEKIHQGLYVFFGHVAGDLLSLIVVLAQARQMSHRPKAVDGKQ